ncbi:MAG: DUF4388 domain-containing protein [Planctomycetes bacterium]|nr:DUF4388 domain-containing protein [Planctomycetota bacterium]
MARKRDGRSLTDLMLFCDDMQQHVRGLTKNLRAESTRHIEEGPGAPKASSDVIRSLRSLAASLQELMVVLPTVPVIEGQPKELDPRVLALGLISQWLDRDGEIAQKARRGIHGHSESIELASVVELIALQRKTGLLRVKGQSETFLLEFEDGDVVHAVSDNAPERDRLGEILVDQGALDRDVLRDLLMKYRGSRRRLGTHFEIQQLVGEAGLRRALEEQVQRLFHRLFAAKDAYFEFMEDAGTEHFQKVRLGAMSLLLESAHMIDTERDAQTKLRGTIDLDEILSDDETRMRIVASAAAAGEVVDGEVESLSAIVEDEARAAQSETEAQDDSATGTRASDATSATEPSQSTADEREVDDAADEDLDEDAADDPAMHAISFLRKYGIGTRKWVSELSKGSREPE